MINKILGTKIIINMVGLSEVKEYLRGFVGSVPPPIYDTAKNGRRRIKFELGCGESDEGKNRFTIWRHCFCYDDLAESLSNIKIGDWLKLYGLLTCEALRDENYQVVIDSNEYITKKEYFYVFTAEILERKKAEELQPVLFKDKEVEGSTV